MPYEAETGAAVQLGAPGDLDPVRAGTPREAALSTVVTPRAVVRPYSAAAGAPVVGPSPAHSQAGWSRSQRLPYRSSKTATVPYGS
ncbi:hypothetical protein GCM10010274_10260 [Streptomyces lavendofoliae]|uniref:Uncharacterized protein n=1 Tax=Streptomyces lavendofoliae TaxID=67314 RepID=A0A918M315_9ACTN|nr:hypothetical protein GCM10010274_10260 [Streptomyces lavendofoliae]